MADQKALQKIFNDNGFSDYRWIDPSEIVVSRWVRMKCMYGCNRYVCNVSSPPSTFSVDKCRAFFSEFNRCAVFHIDKRLDDPGERHAWSHEVSRALSELKRQISIAGYQQTFMLLMVNCTLCRERADTSVSCSDKKHARPCPEGMGVDVLATVSKLGYPISMLDDYKHEMNRYAFLLIK